MPGPVRHLSPTLVLMVGALWASLGIPASAQLTPIDPLRKGDDGSKPQQEKVAASAEFSRPDSSGKSVLSVTAKIAKGWHIYSITQAKGGPTATKVNLDKSSQFKPPAEFQPTKPAEVHTYPEAWKDLKVEEHHGAVTWKGTIELSEGVDPAKLEIRGAVFAQACADQCIAPKSYKFTARLAKSSETSSTNADATAIRQASAVEERTDSIGYSSPAIHARLTGEIRPGLVEPGGTLQLVITAEPAAYWHVYALADRPAEGIGARPTLIELTETSGLRIQEVKADAVASQKSELDGKVVRYHSRPVTWTVTLEAPGAINASQPLLLAGIVGFQTCSTSDNGGGQCDQPHAARFNVTLDRGNERNQRAVPLIFTRAKYGEAEQIAKARLAADSTRSSSELPRRSEINGSNVAGPKASVAFDASKLVFDEESEGAWTLLGYLGAAFLGGLILNLMPCVLPVLGLKVLSFVEQGHHDRLRVFKLNLWYTGGVMTVFLALASLPVIYQAALGQTYNWGRQFSDDRFSIAIAALVFTMGLSMLGVWEIPIPGFAGGKKAHDLMSKEGAGGAFAKGIITTILATPCLGPFVGGVLGWVLRQPPYLIYAVFGAIGLGLASPYLLIGAFPRMMRFLPKPGAWMDTFKQIMGFVLLGTVVFFLWFIETALVVPTVAFLFGLWAACWWIGRIPAGAPRTKRVMGWGWAVAFAGVVGLVSFDYLAAATRYRQEEHLNNEFARLSKAATGAVGERSTGNRLPWQPFSREALEQLTREQKTVMVDFTADWCLTCKTLEATVLNTARVKKVVEENGVVPLVADYTKAPPDLDEMLAALRSGGVPVLAIFPAGRPNEPLIFRNGYTTAMLLEALEDAGPSERHDSAAVAMRDGAE